MQLKVYKINPEATLPTYSTKRSACFDLFACLKNEKIRGFDKANLEFNIPGNGSFHINPGDRILVPTGLIFDIPEGYSVRLHPRSGNALKIGLVLANAEGVVDEDYVEPTYVLMTNVSTVSLRIDHGMRIAQGEVVYDQRFEIVETETKPNQKSDRDGGFGSTGV